ncbi:peptidase [Streptomyces sp. Ru62]|uniref:site-2 protease family protein n=1 Tax=Streptomyces sp. Ru62 TaxID=2080745 RepID=UPI000CDE3257|nr:site-2 protease family protein [Streptomyces sp. Ru62]POX62658.1 peptidase [Streptomyces sp. Ru62]
MDVSGGSGQPRSGNDEPAEHSADPTAPATGPTDPPGPEPGPPRPADRAGHGTEEPAPAPTGRPGPADRPTEEATASSPGTDGAGGADSTGGNGGAGGRNSTDDRTSGSTTDTAAAPTSDAARTPDADRAREADSAPGPDGAPGAHTPAEPDHRTPDHRTPDHRTPDHRTPDHRAPDDTPRPDTAPAATHHTAAPEHRSLAHSGIAKGEPPEPRPKEPGGGILMGRPFGVPVYVAPSWFLVAALITWVFGGQLDRVLPELGAARYLVSLFFAVAFYASVLVHELAHTVAAIRFKLPVRRIQLQFFGGVSEIEKEAETPGREFVLAFVGPLLSLALAGLFYLAMRPVEPGTVPGVLLAGLMVSNLIVAIFNLLPGLPLDGGRMLRAVVWKISGKPMTGTVAAAWVGRALAVSVLIGLPLLNQSGALGGSGEDVGGMDTVTDALLAAILAAIIWTGAGNSLRMARLREHLPELRARTLTRRAVPVENDTPLSEALRRANAAGARALVVVDADGNPLSLVREAAIVGVPEHRRPWVAVSGLAQELTDGMRVSAELAGEELLDVLRATPATEYLVVEETGEIYGVLSAADVERAFVRAMARPT